MINRIKSLNIFLRGFIYSSTLSLGLYILMIPMLFFKLGEYPNGLLLGEFISYAFCFFIGLFSNKLAKKSTVAIIVILVLRILVLGAVMFLVGYLYYEQNLHIFNLFTVTGGYFIPIIVIMIVALVERRREESVR